MIYPVCHLGTNLPLARRGPGEGACLHPMGVRRIVLQTPSQFAHPMPLLFRQHRDPLSPLAATLMVLPASVANKRLAAQLTPLDATLTKNRGVGAASRPLNISTFVRSNDPLPSTLPVPRTCILRTIGANAPLQQTGFGSPFRTFSLGRRV